MKMRMRDLLKVEHPECISEYCLGGCDGCPTSWGYGLCPGECKPSEAECTACWNRETQPGTVKKVMVRAARTLAALCDQFERCEDCPLWNGEECKLLAEDITVVSEWEGWLKDGKAD